MAQRYVGSQPRPSMRRLRLSVPTTDTSVLDWLGAQSDVNASVRTLIREAIAHHGYEDVTCLPVTGKSVVSPSLPEFVQTKEHSGDTADQRPDTSEPVIPEQSKDAPSVSTESESSASIADILGSLR